MSNPFPFAEKRFASTFVLLLVLCLALMGAGQSRQLQSIDQSQRDMQATEARSAAPDQIEFLHMNSSTSGWAITNNKEVVHTTDGGKTWQKVLTHAMLQQEVVFPDDPQPGFFPTVSTSWIVAGTPDKEAPFKLTGLSIYHTTDAGQHWRRTVLSNFGDCGDGPDLTFSDSQHGWLLCSFGAAAGTGGKHLSRTNDGGQTWTRVDSLTVPVSGYAKGLTFKDASTGWMNYTVYASNCLHLSVTHDGGVTWQDQSIPALCTRNGEPVVDYPGVFFDQLHGVIPVDTFSGNWPALHPIAYMYVTSDGGRTWRQLSAISGTATTANYADAHHTWIISSDGKMLYASSDGGQTWQPRSKNPGGTALDFVTTQVGWETGNGLLFKTINGGQNWAQQSYSFSG